MMLERLRKFFWQVVARFRSSATAGVSYEAQQTTPPHLETAPPPEPSEPPRPRVEETSAPVSSGDAADAPAETPPQPLNRSQRRKLDKYERARRKQDKFVQPQGPQPIKRERESTPRPEPRPPVEVVEQPPDVADAEYYIVDKINDIDEDVLIKETEFYGEFNFRDSILDQLDRYWVYLERMKKYDLDAYGFYKQVGATIVPRISTHTHARSEHKKHHRHGPLSQEEIEKYKKEIYLPPWFKAKRPSFGCLAFGAHSLTEKHELELKDKRGALWVPKFMYFTKFRKPPPEVQPMSGGDIYKMTVWWDRPQDKRIKWGKPTEFAIFIDTTGTKIQVLRTLDTKIVVIPKKHSSWEASRIPQRAWRIPDEYDKWAAEYGLDPQLHLAHLFCLVVNRQEQSNFSMVRIAVSKGDLTATFGVAIRRIAYFFQDRDIQLTQHGVRRPIFHFVRPYTRSDGVHVKAHFAGTSKFTWAGYDVNITVPGRDHFLLSEMNVAVDDSYWLEKNQKYLTEPEFGKFLTDQMKAGLGKHR